MAWLGPDAIAGASVWALVIPQAIAYAAIVGVAPQYGLYTVLGASVMYAIFASTNQVVTGPSATVAAVAASVAVMVTASTAPDYLTVVVGLTLAAGIIYLLLGLFRMGWVANFLSKSVLEGFVFAFGFGLLADQLHKVLGVPKVEGSYWQVLVGTVREIPQTSIPTLAVGATAITLLLVLRYTAPKVPRSLLAVVLGIGAASVLDLATKGVALVGPLPSGLPHLTLPIGLPASAWPTLIAGSFAVILVGYSESLATAKSASAKHGTEVSADQEMIAQGAAFVGSSLLGGFPVDGSLSKTSVADGAGQKTQLAGLVVAGLTVVTLLFLAGAFANLPKAVLGAVVIDAAVGLIHPEVFRRFLTTSKRGFVAFAATAIGLFFVGVVAGVLLGVIISLLLLVATASKSPLRRMGFDSEGQVFVDADSHPAAETIPGILVVELGGPLFFADAEHFRSALLGMATQHSPVAVIVDLGPAADIDLDGADIITKVSSELALKGTRLLLARVDDGRLLLLDRAGTLDAIGRENVYPSVRAAVSSVDVSLTTDQKT
jgi:high affinity sulfate transporter 1